MLRQYLAFGGSACRVVRGATLQGMNPANEGGAQIFTNGDEANLKKERE